MLKHFDELNTIHKDNSLTFPPKPPKIFSNFSLTDAQKQADNFLAHRAFHAAIGEEIRAEEKAQLENEKNQKFTKEQKATLYAAHVACKRVFNGTYTITNPKTNEHRTIKIETVLETESPLFGKRIISLMTGSCNESSFTSFGFFDTEKGISIFKKARTNAAIKIDLDKFAPFVHSVLVKGKESPFIKKFGCTIEASKNCILCNRKLTTPSSLLMGIGDKCYKDLHGGK